MLVLTRVENQGVVVGTERPLEVVVVSVRGDRVKLGFRDLGPHQTKVTRTECIAGAEGAPEAGKAVAS